jgi:N-methylhydantoinase A
MADVTHDASRALLTSVGTLQGDPASIQRAASALTEKVESALEGHGTPEVAFELDLRYVGQSYEVTVPLASPVTAPALGGAAEAFHDRHRRRYGHAAPEAPVEAVALRARGTVPVSPPPLPQEPETDLPLRDAEIGTRPVWFSPGGPAETTAYARTALHHGHTLEGPAVLHQYDTTIVVPPGWRARVDAYRNVWIER